MDEKILTSIVYNGEEYQIGGGNTEAAFTLTENNGAKMSACTSTGNYAVAEGVSTTASGGNSHAEGGGTTASGAQSHAEGLGTSATTNSEHASGRYNVSLSGSSDFGNSGNTLFTVGNGDSSANTHNALQIMQNGDIYIADTSGTESYYQKPMIKLQDLINRISELETKVAVLESNEVTKTEVEKGFNNVITVVDDNKLKIRNNALEDESTD